MGAASSAMVEGLEIQTPVRTKHVEVDGEVAETRVQLPSCPIFGVRTGVQCSLKRIASNGSIPWGSTIRPVRLESQWLLFVCCGS